MTITPLLQRFARLAIAAVAAAVAATTEVNAQPAATYEVVSRFDIPFLNGSAPSSLRQADDGSFYGTTSFGGVFDRGTLFRMDATGVVTVLHNFSGSNDGLQPFGLVRALDRRFYGLTSQSLTFGFGTVFTFTPAGALTTVHTFSEADRSPVDLFAASDGNVYGLTSGGGDFGNGTIFVIDPSQGFRTIHSIPLSAGRGMTSLVRGSDGRFYVTADGGDAGEGTLFVIDDAGTLTILHSFGTFSPPKGLMQARDGKLYGTTGRSGSSDGTVYSIDLAGNFSSLHAFLDNFDGREPETDLVEASDGNLYGVTTRKLFRVDSSGTVTPLVDLFGFSTRDLIQGTDGRLYVTTGSSQTIVALDLQTTTLTTLHQFTIGESVGRPNGVIQARNGQFYGTTQLMSPQMTGTTFAMDATGARTTLHTFAGGRADGIPMSNLVEAADGSLYGTTAWPVDDLNAPPGQIFRLSPAGDFTTLSSARFLRAGLIQARDGRLYGTSSFGLISLMRFYGDIFRVEADGTRTVLHVFGGGSPFGGPQPVTSNPVAELVEIDDGSLYGTAAGGPIPTQTGPPPPGGIFRLDPATGSVTIRHLFTDGVSPTGRLIQGTDGLIYGTTVNGGAFGLGTVFSLDAAGTLTTLHHFAGPDGANPSAGVIQGLDGRLYGTTRNGGAFGGAFGYGTVFVMNVTGGLTTLHHFALTDGANPVNELIQANDGAFYGAAPLGGPTGGGVIFRVRMATSPTDQYVEIVSRNSGKCLDVSSGSTDAGAPAIQWTCHGGPNQQWRLEPAGGGAFRIIARHSGHALDVSGGSIDDVAPIIQWPAHGGDNQAWTLEPASDGYVRLVVRHSGKAMDVELGSIDDSAHVIQYPPHGGANQQWLLRPVD